MKGKENIQELLNRQKPTAGIPSPASPVVSAVPGTSTKPASLQLERTQPSALPKMPLSPADSLSQNAVSESPSDFSDAEDLPRDSNPSDGSDFEGGPARCSSSTHLDHQVIKPVLSRGHFAPSVLSEPQHPVCCSVAGNGEGLTSLRLSNARSNERRRLW